MRGEAMTRLPEYRRRRLAQELRGPLPEGLVWNYGEVELETFCGTEGCALAVAKRLWPEAMPESAIWEWAIEDIGEFFGMRPLEVTDVFYRGDQVTAAEVADRLEAIGFPEWKGRISEPPAGSAYFYIPKDDELE